MRLKYRKIYDDDGNDVQEGSLVRVNGIATGILHFDSDNQITISGTKFTMEEIETVEALPDDRHEGFDDSDN